MTTQDASANILVQEREAYRTITARIPGTCLLETDRSGLITCVGESSETFFGFTTNEIIGRMNYKDFHAREEMEACKDDPEFARKIAEQGWTEDEWTVVPKNGNPFRAVVTLVRKPAAAQNGQSGIYEEGEGTGGWIALYRRMPNP